MAALSTQIGHTIAALLVGWLVLTAYRWIRLQSHALAVIVAVTIVVRIGAGLALFWVSYAKLPVAESLQGGGGFWMPTLDAIGYYDLAAGAADAGTWARDPRHVEVPSPVFVNTLATWMRVVGVSPAAGMFLNLCLYLAFVVALVRFFRPANDWRRDLPCLVAVAAYSFSPVVLFHSTQPLKEEFTNVLVAIACLTALVIVRGIRRPSLGDERWIVAAGTIGLAVTVAAVAGVRWYYAVLLWSTLAMVLVAFAIGARASFPLYAARAFAVLLLAWAGFWIGAGPYYGFVAPHIRTVSQAVNLHVALASMAQVSRAGFLTTVGDTNIIVPLREEQSVGRAHLGTLRVAPRSVDHEMPAVGTPAAPAPPPAPEPGASMAAWQRSVRANRAIPVTAGDHLRVTAIGLAITFLPLTVASRLVPIDMAGGDGLLWVTDLDVLILDAGLAALLVMLWRRRDLVGDRLPLVLFAIVFSAAVAVLLGYVVTNFGALSRMRPMIGIPMWTIAAALTAVPQARTQERTTGAAAQPAV